MKRYLRSLMLLASIPFSVFAQEKTMLPAPKLSPLTQQYLVKSGGTTSPLPGYVYRKDGAGKLYISALIEVGSATKEDALVQLGAVIGTKAGAIWTVHIPLDKVAALTQIAGLSYIQLDEPVFPTMDSVRKVTRVDSVHAGLNLPQAFTGKNVVLGILDVGFDYTHPLFYDTTGTRYRVKKIWEEKTIGTPPAGHTFGNELTDTLLMRAAGSDNIGQSHGTHVAGIAGGSGVGSSTANNKYRGVGFGTDVVLVGITPPQSQWMNTGMTDLIEGMSYVYTYAASVGKPSVVNLSWGCSTGPHDGLSLFSKAVDNLTGSGKLFVCSAGNTGADRLHLQKTFTATDTLLSTVVTFDAGLSEKKTWVDAWGDSTKNFCAAVTLYNGATPGNSTGFVCLDNTAHNLYLLGSAGDTCFVDMTTSAAEFNGKPRIFFSLRNKTTDAVNLVFKSTNAKVNVWEGYVENSTGYYGEFSAGSVPGAVTGNTELTTSDFSATKSAISVGAFAARNTYVNSAGLPVSYTGYVTRGRIVPFSSRGPLADGRISPDITAPGFLVASGVNSFDASFQTGGSDYSSVMNTYTLNGRNYSYAMLSGTSMSSPVVSGIAALMLEVNPTLTPQAAKDVMAQTAIIDTYTGALTAAGNNIWGHGKINAYGAVKKLLHDLSINQAVTTSLKWSLYPNPNKGAFNISCTSAKQQIVKLDVYDLLGRILLQQEWPVNIGSNNIVFNAGNLAKGIYFTKMTSGNSSSTIKTVIE